MAEGALAHSRADIAAAVTGIAGPAGGSGQKPVGLVHVAVTRKGRQTVHRSHTFSGGRERVRVQAVGAVLGLLKGIAD